MSCAASPLGQEPTAAKATTPAIKPDVAYRRMREIMMYPEKKKPFERRGNRGT
jgi:hypothetical protein